MPTNDFYDSTGEPSTGSSATSSVIRSEFDKIETGFTRLAPLYGNNDMPLFVNSGATAYEAKSIAAARELLGVLASEDVYTKSESYSSDEVYTKAEVAAYASPIAIASKADMVAATLIENGLYSIRAYLAGGGGAGTYLIKTIASYGSTPDGYIDFLVNGGTHVAVLQHSGLLHIKQSGAVGDGSTDDTTALQALFDFAATNGLSVLGDNSTYSVTTVKVKNGIKNINLRTTTFKGRGSTDPLDFNEAVVVVTGLLTGAAEVVDGLNLAVRVDMSAGDRTAILCDGTTNSRVEKCYIYGFTDDATHNHRGIRAQEAVENLTISRNIIRGVDNPTQRGLLIDIWGAADPFGGFNTGTVTRATAPSSKLIITENILIKGSYGITLQAVEKSNIAANICEGQNHRGIYASSSSWNLNIVFNTILDFTSSAILLGYGSSQCLVAHNILKNEGVIGLGGEAAVNINTGATGNEIRGNLIDAPVNYGIYVGPDCSDTVIDGNRIKNSYVAHISVENDWILSRPTNSYYTRPNYADPTVASSTSWTFNDLENVVIKGNVMGQGYPGRQICAISIAHIRNDYPGATPTEIKDIYMVGNVLTTMDNIAYCLYLYNHVSGEMSNVKSSGNIWPPTAALTDFSGATEATIPVDVKMLGLVQSDNDGIMSLAVHGSSFSFTDGDTTPSVANWEFFAFDNTTATTVTNFDGEIEGKCFSVRFDANTTVAYGLDTIRTIGSVDLTGLSTNSIVSFRLVNGVWFEMSRNF